VKSWFWWPLPCESYVLEVLDACFSAFFCGLFHVAFSESNYVRFLMILGALRHPFRPLWGHITAVFPLLIFSRFLRCVFITFRLPRGVPKKVGG
jgi:hypothetical protein